MVPHRAVQAGWADGPLDASAAIHGCNCKELEHERVDGSVHQVQVDVQLGHPTFVRVQRHNKGPLWGKGTEQSSSRIGSRLSVTFQHVKGMGLCLLDRRAREAVACTPSD